MNMRILDSKEGLGVNFKDGICAEYMRQYIIWFESNWYFCNVTESEPF